MKKIVLPAICSLGLLAANGHAALYSVAATNANAAGSDFVLAGVNKNLVFDLTGVYDSDTGLGSLSGTATSTNGGNAFPVSLEGWTFSLPNANVGGTIAAWDLSNCTQANTPANAVCTTLGANVAGSLVASAAPVGVAGLQQWTMTSAALSGTWDVQVEEVPVPAAVWMFGSAMLGLLGIAKRQRSI